MTYYYDTVCIMLETAWITLQCTLFCLSVQSDKHFSRGYVSSPLPTATEGVELICQLWLILSPQRSPPPSLCSEHSALRLTTSLCRCFSVTPSTELRLWGAWWQRSGLQHRLARTVWPIGGGSSSRSQPTCLYYIVLTKSLCLTTPFLYSNGETLLVYVFDICTNAPL